MNKRIHIISFNVPYPADYGGVIDVYYKMKALHNLGVKIILHCFQYGRDKSIALEPYCENIYYYKRLTGLLKQFSKKPYIVASRVCAELIKNLEKDSSPILFEGLHTTGILNNIYQNREILIRTHNIEHDYYNELAKGTSNPIRKLYYKIESKKLKSYEKILTQRKILAISPNDYKYFHLNYGSSIYIPAFHPFEQVLSKSGKGDYILYHGNLSVPENTKVANYLIDNIVPKVDYPFIIAGKDPDTTLIKKIEMHSNAKLISNPNNDELGLLLQNAHINLLPTFQDTGIKLKLLYALYNGRHCIVNDPMVQNTGLEELCQIGKSTTQLIELCNTVIQKEYSEEQIESRSVILGKNFSNKTNAKKIINLLNY